MNNLELRKRILRLREELQEAESQANSAMLRFVDDGALTFKADFTQDDVGLVISQLSYDTDETSVFFLDSDESRQLLKFLKDWVPEVD